MSVTRVQLVGNVSTGASFVGVVTATSFIGNVTGTASTASFATTSFGLSGTPNITVGTIGATSLNASGVVTATSFSGSGANLTGIATTENVRTNSLVVSGISTLGTVVVGGATTQLIVVGNARVTGILTIGTGSITLNGSTNIINVGTGLTLSSSGIVAGVITATSFSGSGANLTGIANTANIVSDTITVGVLTATSINVPPIPIIFSPAIGATSVNTTSNIIITFSQLMQKGTGNITLRENSAGGTAFSTIGVSSSSVTISGGAVTIDPPSNIGFALTTFVVVDAGAFAGITTTSTSALINTYSFTTKDLETGDPYEGGFLICKASPLRWVVSPYSAEVSRTWHLRDDANTTAQSVSGCTGWFVPTISQLQNPGYCCRSFWGPSPCYSLTPNYWSSTENTPDALFACRVNFNVGTANYTGKQSQNCVRAFRCVTY
jgi:hypothetical protein